MSKKIAIGLVVTLMLFITACGTSTVTPSSSQPASNTNQTNSSQPQTSVVETPKGSDTQVGEAFSSFQGDQPAKMSGNGNKEFKLAMPEGGFKLVMK